MSTTTAIPAAPAGVEALSGLPQAVFVACLGDIFEHSPWVPERAWAARPFASIDALHAAMVAVVDQAAEAEQLAATTLREYTVVKGDTLSAIGKRFGVKWRDIAELNDIKNPDLIFPGQVFKIPNA